MRQALSVRAEGGIKLFLVEPPTPSLMKTEIRVEETDGFAKPFLHGNKLPQEQALAWSSRAQAFKQDNKDVIQGHLGRALVSVPPSNGVLQMRAKFGTFTLDEWTKPATGDTYQFKEFRDILRRDSVAGRLLPGFMIPVSHCSDLIANIQIRICLSENELFKRIREAKDLLVPWGDVKLDPLLKIAPRHSASFDFQAGTDGIIRVEVNFSLLEGTSEFEVSGSRCFKPRKPCKPKDSKEAKDSKGPIKPMQIGMIDFERYGGLFLSNALSILTFMIIELTGNSRSRPSSFTRQSSTALNCENSSIPSDTCGTRARQALGLCLSGKRSFTPAPQSLDSLRNQQSN